MAINIQEDDQNIKYIKQWKHVKDAWRKGQET